MRFVAIAISSVLALVLISATSAIAADEMKDNGISKNAIIIDAPDIRKIPENVIGPRFSTLLGEPVYSNSGKLIGEIEDFVMARGGEMYAVIDTENGPLAELAELVDDEKNIVIVSLRELRRSDVRESPSAKSSTGQ